MNGENPSEYINITYILLSFYDHSVAVKHTVHYMLLKKKNTIVYVF